MIKVFQQIVQKMTLQPQKLFLIDSFGAMVSAFSLGIVLVKLENTIGMPSNILYWLALVAGIFAIYSFSCFLKKPKNWRPFLKAIAFSNLLYCIVTLGLVAKFYEQLTVLGSWLPLKQYNK